MSAVASSTIPETTRVVNLVLEVIPTAAGVLLCHVMDFVGRAVVAIPAPASAASTCAVLLLHVSLEPHVSLVAVLFIVEGMLSVVLHVRD